MLEIQQQQKFEKENARKSIQVSGDKLFLTHTNSNKIIRGCPIKTFLFHISYSVVCLISSLLIHTQNFLFDLQIKHIITVLIFYFRYKNLLCIWKPENHVLWELVINHLLIYLIMYTLQLSVASLCIKLYKNHPAAKLFL